MQENEFDLKELLNNLTVGVYRRTIGLRGQFLFVNLALEKILGYSQSELLKIRVSDLFEDQEKFRKSNELTCRQGRLSAEEVRLIDKNRKVIWCLVSSAVIKDKYGDPKWIDGFIEDISSQKKAERDLRESKELFQTVFNNSAAAITVTDKDEKIIAWNPFAEKMLEMGKEVLFNKPVQELYPPEEWKRIRSFQIRKKGMLSDIETQVYKKDGHLLDVNMSISVLKDAEGGVTGSIGIMQDITEHKRSQKALIEAKRAAEEASSSKSLFLANMSHEVRTPMNTILGMLELTLDTELTAEQRENLKMAKDGADNLLSLLNDILDLSRVEAGKINLEMIEINLHNIVKSVCQGLLLLAKKKDLDLSWEVDPKVSAILVGDPVRIRQVLVNLINNAIKFTFKGKIEVKMKLSALSEQDCEILTTVSDQGIGVPSDKKEMIFNVFTQADDSTTRKYGGTGLGLAISKRLVEMMGGR
ncbi:MAG: PAS domain S-box protein, partial [Candidatus Omnitrophota bacterium]